MPQKIKYLIAMAIEAEHETVHGAIALGKRAIALGATKEEIVETLQVAYYIGGTSALYTSAMTLQSLFKKSEDKQQKETSSIPITQNNYMKNANDTQFVI